MDNNSVIEGSSEVKTELSPLKKDVQKRGLCFNLICKFENGHSGSLKTIIVALFGTTGAITLALLAQIYYGDIQIKPRGSVLSDSYECSNIGIHVLKKGGNAVDAAIATSMCLGVVHFHITGIGGGGYFMLYNHRKHRIIDVIDFREMVPYSFDLKTFNLSEAGCMVGIPGYLKGMWEVHQEHGKLPWKELIMPSSILAKNGFQVSSTLASASAFLKSSEYNSKLKNLLQLLQEGKYITLPELAVTLEKVASKGSEEFYNGALALSMVHSVKVANCNISLNDISQYTISRSEIRRTRIADYEVFVPSSSSGGSLLLNCLDSIEFLDLNDELDTSTEIILKMSDVLHDTYLHFLQKVDAFSNQPESVASQVSVVDGEENYVTIVSGLNTWLGSQILTSEGFILNNALVRGGINKDRRPVSFATPVLITESNKICGKRFILGTGDAIVAAQVLTNLLIFNRNASESIEYPRIIIDNKPRHIRLEEYHTPRFNPEFVEPLKQLVSIEKILPPYKSVNIIEKIFDSVRSYADSRGGGKPAQL